MASSIRELDKKDDLVALTALLHRAYAGPGAMGLNYTAAAGQGIGQQLVMRCEHWARARGFRWLVLDTSEPASCLRRLYAKLGYSDVDAAQWAGKRYRSVIMAKAL